MATGKRNLEIDILKGIGIFYMVFTHGTEIIHYYVGGFHMHLFFIVAGFLYYMKPIKEFIKGKVTGLLFPYFLYTGIFIGIKLLLNLWNPSLFSIDQMYESVYLYPSQALILPIVGSVWFLPAMFFAVLMYDGLSRVLDDFKIKGVVILIITIGAVIFRNHVNYMLPFCLLQSFTALLFMYAGEFIKRHYAAFKKIAMNNYVLGTLFVLHFILIFSNISVSFVQLKYGNPFLFYFNGIISTCFYWMFIIKFLDTKGKFITILRNRMLFLGNNSIVYVLINQMFLNFFLYLFLQVYAPHNLIAWFIMNTAITILSFVACDLLILFHKKAHLEFMFGKFKRTDLVNIIDRKLIKIRQLEIKVEKKIERKIEKLSKLQIKERKLSEQ